MLRKALLLVAALAAACAGERDPDPRDGSPPPPTDADGAVAADYGSTSPCNSNETHFKGYCYFTTGIDAMDYNTASGMCTAMGSQPASIHSQEENDFIYGLLFHMTSAAWIGLQRSGADLGWADGSTFDFTHWEQGEPDDSDCGIMRGPLADASRQGFWADTSCTNKSREIVCKRQP
jgi:hypothetical protein